MKLTKTIAAAGCIGFLAAGAQAASVGGVEYQEFIDFGGINTSQVFSSGGQSFAQGGELSGWTVNVKGTFSNSAYLGESGYSVAGSNLSGAPFQNATFPSAPGIFFGEIPDTYNGDNITVSFAVQFVKDVGANLAALQMAVFSAESVDYEVDTLTHSSRTFSIPGTGEPGGPENLTGWSGDGTKVATFASDPDVLGVGQFTATTDVGNGDVITWTYDYTRVGTEWQGSNMIGFAASDVASSVPTPLSAVLLLTGLAGLGIARRRRAAAN